MRKPPFSSPTSSSPLSLSRVSAAALPRELTDGWRGPGAEPVLWSAALASAPRPPARPPRCRNCPSVPVCSPASRGTPSPAAQSPFFSRCHLTHVLQPHATARWPRTFPAHGPLLELRPQPECPFLNSYLASGLCSGSLLREPSRGPDRSDPLLLHIHSSRVTALHGRLPSPERAPGNQPVGGLGGSAGWTGWSPSPGGPRGAVICARGLGRGHCPHFLS